MTKIPLTRQVAPVWSILLQICILIVCFSAVLVHLPTPIQFISDNDWGLQLAGANQILGGEHPFIDFPIYYGPLVPYVSAFGQIISQEQPLAELLIVFFGYCLAYLLLFNLFRHVSGDLFISLLMLFLALLLIPRIYKYYIVLCPVLVLSGLFWYIKKPGFMQLLLLCFTVVVAGLYRQDHGAYSLLISSFVLILWPLDGCGRLMSVLKFWLVAMVFSLPWLLFLTLKGGFINYLLTSIFQAPKAILSIAHSSTLGTQGLWATLTDFPSMLFSIFQFLPAIGLLILFFQRKQFGVERRIQLVALFLFAQLCLIQGLHRQDYSHTLQAIPLTLVICCWVVAIAKASLNSPFLLKKYAGAMTLFVFVGMVVHCIQYNLFESKRFRDVKQMRQIVKDYKTFAQTREKFIASVALQAPKSSQIRTLQYITDCTQPGEKIMAYVRQTSLYYFSDRMFAGGIMSINPGFPMPEQESNVISQIRNQEPVLFIDQPKFNYGIGERGVFGNYSPELHHYLTENFVTVKKLGPRTISVNRQRLDSLPQRCLAPTKGK